MFHWKEEAEPIKQGLSVYHPKSTHSIGFVLRFGNHVWRVRWSKKVKKLFNSYQKVDPKAYDEFFEGLDK